MRQRVIENRVIDLKITNLDFSILIIPLHCYFKGIIGNKIASIIISIIKKKLDSIHMVPKTDG